MDRRHFITGALACGLSLRLGQSFAQTAIETRIALWPGTPPGGGGPRGAEQWSARGALRNISAPALTLYAPRKPNGRAVLIAAGGGYKRIEMGNEAQPAARWLQSLGYHAYVLSYRLPGEGWNDGPQVALQDAQRALRILHRRESQLSVLGFSAGAHLLGMAITAARVASYPAQDALDALPLSAKGAALIYPVITLQKPWSHTSAHRMLVGPHATDAENAAWSVENAVTSATPPVFLAQAEDDPVASPQNSLLMAAACERAQVPVELHLYRSGGHGFGLGKPGTPAAAWPAAYRQWLVGLGQ